ncbi:EF hand [Teladorsagia circumcincta]|uniref:EF hand n=1 Tax=Teladorsagia circumcincta TaxID=45464 RepID=A0A2G9UWW4_TELCI|nr:EF hand [Teladorsagia circumcincta]
MELAYVDAKKEEFDSLDKDKDGIVTLKEYEEHYHGVTSRSEARRTEYFAEVFHDFDEDFDMSLNQNELERVLAERFLVKPRENFPKLFYSYDHDHSGGLDLTEYMKFDATFPFEQTDPITSVQPLGPKSTSNRGKPSPMQNIDANDRSAIALVMAQGSPTLSEAAPPKAASPQAAPAKSASPVAAPAKSASPVAAPPKAASPIFHSVNVGAVPPVADGGLHPVVPGPSRPSMPIVKLAKLAKSI